MPRKGLPFVFINVASSLDGKISFSRDRFEPFSSPRDRRMMLDIRTGADAVMSGARTIRSAGAKLGMGGLRYAAMRRRKGRLEKHVRVVVSGRASVGPRDPIFKDRSLPLVVITSEDAPKRKVRRLRERCDAVGQFGRGRINFTRALRWLYREWGVRTLLSEGGGELNAGLFEEDLVDEIYLTLSPIVLGGKDAPTPCDGAGVTGLEGAVRAELLSLKKEGSELLLHYRILRRK